jgi:hypothetical protein
MTFMNVPREETSKGHYTGTFCAAMTRDSVFAERWSEERAIYMQCCGDKPAMAMVIPDREGV